MIASAPWAPRRRRFRARATAPWPARELLTVRGLDEHRKLGPQETPTCPFTILYEAASTVSLPDVHRAPMAEPPLLSCTGTAQQELCRNAGPMLSGSVWFGAASTFRLDGLEDREH